MLKTLRVIIILSVMGLLVSGCSTTEKNSNTPEGAFAIAEEFDQGERYEEAIRRYTEVKNKFPYSNFATKAELAIADVYFKQESYAEAQVAYQLFKELHPTAPQSDYVQFRIGLSYYNQLPSSIDRDLTLANDAILNLSELIKKYPNSQYLAEAKEKRSAAIKMLAEKEDYIGNFYFIRKVFDSALSRYEGLYNNYGRLGFDARALSRAAISAQKIGNTEKAKKYEELLKKDFPDSKELKAAQKEIE
ncbi:outer membrane protein assembly factor BamD [Bdellovibrio reynosensis]|uniref:Outer membrane protein assembly factor BamD n=1 Tax=Bdellovibrio reynosensis TaxID=2835041 RepID=A0ABY4C5N3_9BACT|nr:outer membrane protein assembly factor BamD [Bdellovibrio reynosensis]UOF00293.1 outer membrane protein assembly factor BamD [Bdellovibrio reynosensis]